MFEIRHRYASKDRASDLHIRVTAPETSWLDIFSRFVSWFPAAPFGLAFA